MKIMRFLQGCSMLAGGLSLSLSWAHPILSNESDAMQITTHLSNLTGIACDNTSQYCVAVGTEPHSNPIHHLVYTTSNGGIIWSAGTALAYPDLENQIKEPENSAQNLMTLRCDRTGQHCLIAGTTQIAGQRNVMTYTSHDGGITWTLPNLLAFPADTRVSEDVSLPLQCNDQASSCILAVNTIRNNQHVPTLFTTQNSGDNWSTVTALNLPLHAPYGIHISDIDCDQTGLFCTALTATADDDELTFDSTRPYPALAPAAYIYSTHDGGLTWSDAKPMIVPEQINQSSTESHVPSILNCDQSGLTCIALGTHYTTQTTENSVEIGDNATHAYITQNGGLTWQVTPEIMTTASEHSIAFTALHCDLSNRFCSAVGAEFDNNTDDNIVPIIYTSIDSGQTWQKKLFTPTTNSNSMILDVFCAEDAALCHAVGISLEALQ